MLPVCASEADLHSRLRQRLNVAAAEARECPVCLDPFPAADGLSCARAHFVCNGCLDRQVVAVSQRDPAELANQPHLVPCAHLDCAEGHTERALVRGRMPDQLRLALALFLLRMHFPLCWPPTALTRV